MLIGTVISGTPVSGTPQPFVPAPVPLVPSIIWWFPPPSTEFALVENKQSGQVTPGHLAAWATDGVLIDAGVQFNNTFGKFVSTLTAVDFNKATNDNPISINLPAGYAHYRIEQVIVANATASLLMATCALFTQPQQVGIAIVPNNTALTINSVANDTNNNMQILPLSFANSMALADAIIYFRTQIAQGSPALATVSVYYQPLP